MLNRQPLVAIVEDDAEVRIAFARLLDCAGFATQTFGSGEAFLSFTGGARPDCVVLDLNMPGLSGFEVQARLAELDRDIPVVLITGQDSASMRAHAAGTGAKSYLCKPVDEDTLLAAIAAAMERRAIPP